MAAIGDIFEINVGGRYAYARISHQHQTYGSVLEIDPKLYTSPLSNAATAGFQNILLFPLSQAIEKGTIRGRQRCSIAPAAAARPFPHFRFAVLDSAGAPIYWWLWDGSSITPSPPDKDISGLPIRQLLTVDAFIGNWDTN